MYRRFIFVIIMILLVAACQPNAPEPTEAPPEPVALLSDVISNLRQVETFRLLIQQTGAAFYFLVSLDEGVTTVPTVMRRGEAQYKAPDTMFAKVNLRVSGLPPIAVDLYAEGLRQWFRLASSGWIYYPIAEGFDPGVLMEENSGFSRALTELREVEYMGQTTLIDGTDVHHVQGTADGEVVNELLFGLLEIYEDNVLIDVFVNPATRLPAMLNVTIPDTATDTEGDSVWSIEIYDYNDTITYDAPEDAATDES